MSNTLLDGKAVERLAKIAGMFGSDHDGERAAAALKFHAALHSEGVSVTDLLDRYCYLEQTVRRLTAEARSAKMPRIDPGVGGWMRKPAHLQHQSKAAECLTCLDVSDWEREFLNSITEATSLSPKQSACLDRIHSRLRAEA